MPIRVRAYAFMALLAALLLAGCSRADYPALPGIPDELREIPRALDGLKLPDLGNIALPGLDQLGVLTAPPGAIVYVGPAAPTVAKGERLPGTDIMYMGQEGDDAIFQVAGERSPKRMADSMDFKGAWPGLPGSTYETRLRIYALSDASVSLAGVQQLLIPEIAPERGPAPSGGSTLHFPFIGGVRADGVATIAGTTIGYLGKYERGAQLTGLFEGEYPYRAVGDTIVWEGALRPNVGVKYDLRTLTFGRDSLRVGGTVAVTLPTQ